MKDSARKTWISVCLGLIFLIGLLSLIFRSFERERDPSFFSCISNLKQIDLAIQLWAHEGHKSSNDVVTITDISGGSNTFTKALINSANLHCPAGGIYRVTRVGEKPTCSIPGHSLDDWKLHEPTTPLTNRYE